MKNGKHSFKQQDLCISPFVIFLENNFSRNLESLAYILEYITLQYTQYFLKSLKKTYLITEKRVLKSWIKISLQSSNSKQMLYDLTQAKFLNQQIKITG